MAKSKLPVNFQDDIMNSSMGGKRRYNVIQNADGTISLEDATSYDQVGSNFGAGQINATNTAVNASADAGKIIDDIDAINAVTQEGYIAGALALKQVNSDLGNCINYIGDNKDILPTTTKTYTATQNGILNVTMTCKDIYSYTDTGRLAITLNNGFKEIRLGGANTYAMTANMPMKKGQTATIECNGTVSSVEFFHL